MEKSKQKYIGLGNVPIGIGAVLKGWDVQEGDFRNPETLPIVDFRAMTNACPHDCFHCFTDKQKKTLTLDEIKGVLDQCAEMKCVGVDYLGEGEPTIDNDFLEIIRYTREKGIQPVIFTDAATKLRNKGLVRKLNELQVTIVPKCDSLFNSEYQNWVVGDKTGTYFDQRNEALELLIQEGFNDRRDDGTTRLGFDMVLSKKNIHEVERTLTYCRDNNLWVGFAFHLPTGRSGRDDFDQDLVVSEKDRTRVRKSVGKIDERYGHIHPIYNNFATVPCVEITCIYGDGRVSPCVGNETIIGNVRTDSIKSIVQKLYKEFPCHNPKKFDGHCIYRPKIKG